MVGVDINTVIVTQRRVPLVQRYFHGSFQSRVSFSLNLSPSLFCSSVLCGNEESDKKIGTILMKEALNRHAHTLQCSLCTAMAHLVVQAPVAQ